jgi:hypothetical protein
VTVTNTTTRAWRVLTPTSVLGWSECPKEVLLDGAAEQSVGVFNFIPGYRDAIYDAGKEPILVVLVSFLIAFACTRGYTRLARRKGWGSGSVGGVHLHHNVPGLILALVGGLLAYTPFSDDPWVRFLGAILFGVGSALVLDEFALIFHLDDVYWSEEGRSSVDATIMGAIACGALLVVSAPFGLDEVEDEPFLIAFTVIAFNVLWALICFVKSKPFVGTAGILLTPIAFVGATRLAKPHSPWARMFYKGVAGPPRTSAWRLQKLVRAELRAQYGFSARLRRWFEDLIGGKPSLPPLPTVEDIGAIPFVTKPRAEESAGAAGPRG